MSATRLKFAMAEGVEKARKALAEEMCIRDSYERFGMGEENAPFYLCRGVKFDIQKIWWRSHHWN